MLHEALEELLAVKSFEKITVGEIAEKAGLNRATFYDHYSDKLGLLEGLVSTRFQELLDKRNVLFEGGCAGAALAITLAMCDYLAGLSGTRQEAEGCDPQRGLERHLESALMSVVRGMILTGLQAHSSSYGASKELVAATASGAIYGGVSEWVRSSERVPAEEAAAAIARLVGPMLH
jgi:AcrR family transcriptional regulator